MKSMKEKHDVSKITISVIVDHTSNETIVKEVGNKYKLSYIQSTSAAAYRGALRDAAYHLLEIAGNTDDGCCTRDQIRVMWEEHRTFQDKPL